MTSPARAGESPAPLAADEPSSGERQAKPVDTSIPSPKPGDESSGARAACAKPAEESSPTKQDSRKPSKEQVQAKADEVVAGLLTKLAQNIDEPTGGATEGKLDAVESQVPHGAASPGKRAADEKYAATSDEEPKKDGQHGAATSSPLDGEAATAGAGGEGAAAADPDIAQGKSGAAAEVVAPAPEPAAAAPEADAKAEQTLSDPKAEQPGAASAKAAPTMEAPKTPIFFHVVPGGIGELEELEKRYETYL